MKNFTLRCKKCGSYSVYQKVYVYSKNKDEYPGISREGILANEKMTISIDIKTECLDCSNDENEKACLAVP